MPSWNRKRLLILCLALGAIATVGWWGMRAYRAYRAYQAHQYWYGPQPEDKGDYAGPMERKPVAYDPGKPPSRSWTDPKRTAPPPLTYHEYPASAINGQATFYLLYLPPGYDDPANAARRYPVIYWLHGFVTEPQHGMPLVEGMDEAIRAGRVPPVIIVLPNGLANSWFVDSVDGSQPVESVIIKDLIPHIDRTYRTIADRRGRATEGFSMGGWGAGHLAFKYPELFCATTMASPPFHAAERFPQMWPIFSNDAAAYYAEDPVTLARRKGDELRGRVKLRLLVGDKDFNYMYHQRFHARLTEWGFPHEYQVSPGAGHDHADVYQKRGPGVFEWYKRVFEGAAE